MLGVGASTGWALVSGPEPEVETITIGRRRLAIVESIERLIKRKRAEPHRKIASPPPGEGRRHRMQLYDAK
jgi:hypothetical protein